MATRVVFTVDYLTFTSAGVCVERVPLVTQTAGEFSHCDYLTFTGAGVCVELVFTVDCLTFTSPCVCVECVSFVTRTTVATRGVLALLFTWIAVTLVHV